MSKPKGAGKLVILTLVVVVIIVASRFEDLIDGDALGSREAPDAQPTESTADSGVQTTERTIRSSNGYERLENCRLVDHRNNDGDSFFVRHGDREFELRLYFADCAEKYYSDRCEAQRELVKDQASDFGGLNIDETVALGQEAKEKVNTLLARRSFTIHTTWERVYGGERYHGFVELPEPSGESTLYLCEWLVREGLARIHTGGAPAPDGRSERAMRNHLKELETQARNSHSGAWRRSR